LNCFLKWRYTFGTYILMSWKTMAKVHSWQQTGSR
jgi:hypothetical protein